MCAYLHTPHTHKQGAASAMSDIMGMGKGGSFRQQKKKLSGKPDYNIKILLLGDSGVGKTSLLERYANNQFKTNLMTTAGVDYKVQHLEIDGQHVKCSIWDTAGQERFHVITRAYYKGAHGEYRELKGNRRSRRVGCAGGQRQQPL